MGKGGVKQLALSNLPPPKCVSPLFTETGSALRTGLGAAPAPLTTSAPTHLQGLEPRKLTTGQSSAESLQLLSPERFSCAQATASSFLHQHGSNIPCPGSAQTDSCTPTSPNGLELREPAPPSRLCLQLPCVPLLPPECSPSFGPRRQRQAFGTPFPWPPSSGPCQVLPVLLACCFR